MKWLLDTFWGRLYLVTQVACLAITIFLCVQFIVKDRADEQRTLNHMMGTFLNYIDALPERDRGQAYARGLNDIQNSMEMTKRELNDARLTKSFYYLMPNLAVGALWAVGYFVAKGLPLKKPDSQ